MDRIIAGLDEAGRGCVIGPLVIAGVSIAEKDEKKLRAIGVKDSKLLPQKKRVELYDKIEKIARDVVVLKVGPCKIDAYKKDGIDLNRIESLKFADIMKMLSPHKAYVDAPDPNLEKYNKFLRTLTGNTFEICAEHKADFNYPVVGAASIMAKVEREREIEKLKETYGDFGSGYSSDEKAKDWMRAWYKKNGNFPEHVVRHCWETTAQIKAEFSQKSVMGFLGSILKK